MFRRAYRWFDDRTGLSGAIGPIARHPVPRGTGWDYALGSSTLLCFVILVLTGTALATVYTPSTSDAFASLQWITHGAVLGNQLRGLHYFAASGMVVLIGLHAMQVFLIGSYKYPREVNWLVGVGLLFLTLAMAFTGQLLRWDQNAVWSVVVGAEQAGRTPFLGDALGRFILGGNTIGGATLSRFFAFHVFLIPALIFASIGFHLYLVLRNGVSEPPQPGRPVDPKTYRAWYKEMLDREGVPFWPDGAWRDVVFGAGVLFLIAALAVIFGPPELGKQPDPTIIQAYPAPDWYFLWYFAALAVIPKESQDVVIIGGPLALATAMILLPFLANRGERSPLRRPWAVATVVLVVIMIGSLLLVSREGSWVPNLETRPLSRAIVGTGSGPVYEGSQLFYTKGCQYCHMIAGQGGIRGPNLSNIAARYTREQMVVRILNGATNMPAYASILTPEQLDRIVGFLQSRR